MELHIRQEKNCFVVKLSDRIEWADSHTLEQAISELVKTDCLHIVFDLDEVKYICSGGIGALVYNLAEMRKKGGGIYIVSDNEYVNFIFETLKFDQVFEGCIFPSFENFQKEILEKSQ